jgi:hypothetical protein
MGQYGFGSRPRLLGRNLGHYAPQLCGRKMDDKDGKGMADM